MKYVPVVDRPGAADRRPDSGRVGGRAPGRVAAAAPDTGASSLND